MMRAVVLAVAAVVAVGVVEGRGVVRSDTPLNEVPMVMSHDAATGYLSEDLINRFTKTQNGSFTTQLECGARAFDLRPDLTAGALYMHHGPIVVKTLLRSAVAEVVAWAARNPSEMVLLFVWDCVPGPTCVANATEVLTSLGIKFGPGCGPMTAGQAYNASALPSGGHVLALGQSCVDQRYQSDIECYVGLDWCYDPKTESVPLGMMESYMANTTAEGAPSSGELWMAQAHWQESAGTIAAGFLHGSSLLLDESRSHMNARTTAYIRNRTYPVLNIVEVNNICDGGNALTTALAQEYGSITDLAAA